MNEHFSRPKSFGAVLDQTFRLSKNNFSTYFMIMIILTGPIILLEALILLLTGTSLFREISSGGTFLEQLEATFNDAAYATTTLGEDLGFLVVGLATLVLYPVAQAAILFAIDAKRRQEEITAGTSIKKAFSRFWPIFGSSLLFSVIVFGIFFVPFLIILFVSMIGGFIHPVLGIFIAIILSLGVLAVAAFLLTRWGLFLPAVVFEQSAPGLGRSWNLTRKNFWRTFGLIVVLGLIIMIVSSVFEVLFAAFLGYSVLYTVLFNIVSLFTTMLFSVGYGIIYFDLKVRNDGDDLMEMIENYDTTID